MKTDGKTGYGICIGKSGFGGRAPLGSLIWVALAKKMRGLSDSLSSAGQVFEAHYRLRKRLVFTGDPMLLKLFEFFCPTQFGRYGRFAGF